MRHPYVFPLSAILLVAGASPDRLPAQPCAPGVLACTLSLDPARPNAYDDSVTDLAYRGELHQVWAIEGPIPSFNGLTVSRVTVYNEDLRSGRRSFNVGFAEPAFGIAEIPPTHPNGGNLYVLAPDTRVAGRDPRIGIMNADGNLIPEGAFKPIIDPITAQPPPGFYTALDVHPSEPQLALFDVGTPDAGASFVLVDLNFEVVGGPFPIEGLAPYFGGGITYIGDPANPTVLVTGQFRSRFETLLGLEYNLQGKYTGRSVRLDSIGVGLPIALGLDSGQVGGLPALFLYEIQTDAIYGLPLENDLLLNFPGPVQALSPACVREPDGRIHLTWANNPDFQYDQILVLENEVVVAALAGTATEYRTSVPPGGKYTLCLETRRAGSPNAIRACCEGQSGEQLPFLPAEAPPGEFVDLDPLPGNDFTVFGIDSTQVVDHKEDVRIYVLGAYDNMVRAFDYRYQPLTEENIATNPLELTQIVQGRADTPARGIAVLDVMVEGQKVPMYALLDIDGPGGTFQMPGASVYFLEDTVLPSAPQQPVPAGTRFAGPITIDLQAGGGGRILLEWDADQNNDLIALDVNSLSIVRIEFNAEQSTMTVISEAPLPLGTLTPASFGSDYPLGGISVLPSGNYLVAGASVLDLTVDKAFLLTPFVGPRNDPDPSLSVKLVGAVDGLLSLSQFLPFRNLGRSEGPFTNYGLDTTFFRQEGQGGVGASYYTIVDRFVTRRLYVPGNMLVGLTSTVAHPGLKAEQMSEESTTVGAGSVYETLALTPTFFNDFERLNYHLHLFNPLDTGDMTLDLDILLDGAVVPELAERGLVLPAARSLYRQYSGRLEKTFQARLRNRGAQHQFRVLVGATGAPAGSVEPPKPKFRRGDVNDDGTVDVGDPINVLQFLFQGGGAPSCPDSADFSDDGAFDVSDPIALLNYLFQGGPAPSAPGPATCGEDVAVDQLDPCLSTRCAPAVP